MTADRFISPCPLPTGASREGLVILAEEGAEIALELLAIVARMQVRASKSLRFGMDEVQPGQTKSNSARLEAEIGDLMGVVDLLCRLGALDAHSIDNCRTAKLGKLAKFMQTPAAAEN